MHSPIYKRCKDQLTVGFDRYIVRSVSKELELQSDPRLILLSFKMCIKMTLLVSSRSSAAVEFYLYYCDPKFERI